MKLSDGVEWGLHCAVLLASLPEGKVLSGDALAEYHGVSKSYLLKHLKAMAAREILVSTSGPRGGFRLAKSPSDITFLEVVRAIEGLESAFRCEEIRQRGPIGSPADLCQAPCAINAAMLKAEVAWRKVLQAQTIGEIARGLEERLPAERREQMRAWLEANAR